MTLTWQVAAPRPEAAQAAEWRSVLRQAAIFEQLARSAGDGRPPLLVINDPARGTPTRTILYVISTGFGAPRVPVDVLVATGTHKFSASTRSEFERAIFDDLPAFAPRCIIWHDADAADLRPCGPFRLHPMLLDAHRVLAIGSVEPHYFAGLTGAHKTLTIGCLGRADIENNHAGALADAAEPFELAGNPVFDGIVRMIDALQAARRPHPPAVAINVVHAGESIVAASAGAPFDSLDQLAPAARRLFLHEIDAPVDVLHLRVPPPLGRSLYQADKAIKNNQSAVRDGGLIVLEAGCEDGVGPDWFLDGLTCSRALPASEASLASLNYRLGDHKVILLRRLTSPARAVRVVLVTDGLNAALGDKMGLQIDRDVDGLFARLGATGRGLRVEDAGVLVVRPRPARA